ncbi:MAG: hypothetical protein ACREJA_10905, partial [Candidatus Methylomirabilales bacterium]
RRSIRADGFGGWEVRATAPLVWAVLTLTVPAAAQSEYSDGPSRHEGLHFSHPLITESVSPDTKLRLDYLWRRLGGAGAEHESTVRLEGEYAFHPSFSIEITVPYAFLRQNGSALESNLGTAEIAFKFANFAFADHGVHLGYGLEFGLPSGNDAKGIGSGHLLEVGPFLNAGYKRRRLEVVAWAVFGIPTNQRDTEPVDTELQYNVSTLYHFTSRIQGLVELDGASTLSGNAGSEAEAHVTPGIKIRPIRESNLLLGLGVGFSVAPRTPSGVRVIASAFYHF